jgi:hypothetical protein
MTRARLHGHDLGLAALVALELAAAGAFLWGGAGGEVPGRGGWRRVDVEAVTRRVEAGDLSGREALWYHAAPRDGQLEGGR